MTPVLHTRREDGKGMESEEQRKRFASELTWTSTGTSGVEKKLLVADSEANMHEVSILQLEPGAQLPSLREGWGIEVWLPRWRKWM